MEQSRYLFCSVVYQDQPVISEQSVRCQLISPAASFRYSKYTVLLQLHTTSFTQKTTYIVHIPVGKMAAPGPAVHALAAFGCHHIMGYDT
jgi:hypothetical protein